MANDEKYDELLKAENQGRRVSAAAAAMLLERFLGFQFKATKSMVLAYVETLDELLERVESRAGQMGWLDDNKNYPDDVDDVFGPNTGDGSENQ